MRRFVVTAVLVVGLGLGAAACGGSSQDSKSSDVKELQGKVSQLRLEVEQLRLEVQSLRDALPATTPTTGPDGTTGTTVPGGTTTTTEPRSTTTTSRT